MFTGIVKLVARAYYNENTIVVFLPESIITMLNIGDSVCISGVCLTIVSIDATSIRFYVCNETKRITTFGILHGDIWVNVELSIQSSDYLGGYVIYGHVHHTATVTDIIQDGESMDIWLDMTNNHSTILTYKGNVVVDGVSLTIAEVKDNKIRVSVIPHTLKITTLNRLHIGDIVNIEHPNQSGVSSIESLDRKYMNKAVKQGRLGLVDCVHRSCPMNPNVGCIIVKDGNIIGRGYHKGKGTPHAEVDAINNSNLSLDGAIMYVTLSPCDHHGTTPPCTDAIIASGIKRVVIGMKDIDPISGDGAKKLSDNGIQVDYADEAIEELVYDSLRYYIHSRIHDRPYFTLKIALSIDGCYRGKDGQRDITSEFLKPKIHNHRAEADAIMVGSNTVQMDNPMLNIRYGDYTEYEPDRICIGTPKRVDHNMTHIYDYIPTYELYKKYNHIIVEGGNRLHTSILKERIVDEIVIFRSESVIDGYRWTIPEVELMTVETVLYPSGESMTRYKVVGYKEDNALEDTKVWDTLEDTLDAFKRGEMVIVMDDESRENEGDLCVLADKITHNQMVEILNHTTGIVCVSLEEQRAKMLNLGLMVGNNTDTNKTQFTISVDHKDTTTGVSALDRLKTVKALSSSTNPSDFNRPGHIYPLIANRGGLQARRGHTEAAVALAKLTGTNPVVVISELQNRDGTMMRYNDCKQYATNTNTKMISISQLVTSTDIVPLEECDVKLAIGDNIWKMVYFTSSNDNSCNLVFIYGDISNNPYIRVHSECFTGDVMRSMHCDCGEQLHKSMYMITNNGSGMIIFPSMHEGRGIGLRNKIRAYRIQKEQAVDTFIANNILGYHSDERSYDEVCKILDYYSITNGILLTENNSKIDSLDKYISSVIPIIVEHNEINKKYLEDKKESFFVKSEPIIDVSDIDTSKIKCLIVSSMWHKSYIDQINDILIQHLNSYGVTNIDQIYVPGSNELPMMCKKRGKGYDVIIVVGILLKGDTLHFENVCNAAASGIMSVQIDINIPIINCILPCLTIQQVEDRITGSKSTLDYIAKTAIYMTK